MGHMGPEPRTLETRRRCLSRREEGPGLPTGLTGERATASPEPPLSWKPPGATAQPSSPWTLRVKSFSEEPAGFSATHM